jgi:hypothetical protein
MTRNDHKIIFMALGFLAVILRDVPRDKQALRAAAIAKLIENFCMDAVAAERSVEPSPVENAAGMTSLFANLIHDNQNNKNLIREAMEALEYCLGQDGADLPEAAPEATPPRAAAYPVA